MVFLHSTYRLMLMALFTTWARGESPDTTCADIEGTCVPEDEDNCSYEIDYPGCEKDEICCLSPDSSLGRQSDPCDVVEPPNSCKKNYGGICKTECPNNRIETGVCSNTCKCCGCKIKAKCKNKHGYCIKKGVDECDGITKNSWCAGKKCTCCIPKCPDSEDCLDASGRCAEGCNDDEEVNRNIKCINDNCVCCVPKKASCANSTCCQAAGGYCNSTCPLGAPEDKTLCEGNDCTCCFPTPSYECPCDNNDHCKSASGRCAHRCQAGERADTSLPCRGKNCVCCVPDCPCHDNSKCSSINGRCDERCNDHEVVDTNIQCEGDNCVCCVPKNNCSCTQECADANGHCDTCCSRDEIQSVSIPCQGDNCVCCVPRIPCRTSSRCAAVDGHCGEHCGSNEISDRSIPCEGNNCVCCVPKKPCENTHSCSSIKGRCKTRCASNESPKSPLNGDGCPNRGCMCCVPNTFTELCKNSDECKEADGFCDQECNDDEGMSFNIPCENRGCGCCIKRESSCPNTAQCAASHGNCKERCDFDEMPDTSIPCNDGHCVCCVPKSPCRSSSRCTAIHGYCFQCCPPNYRNSTVPCVDEDCTCCVPAFKVKTCPSSELCVSKYGGRCDTCCKDDEIRNITISCHDHDDDHATTRGGCACCVPKQPCKDTCECKEANGRCDTKCQKNERPNYKVGCEGENCVCCVRTCKYNGKEYMDGMSIPGICVDMTCANGTWITENRFNPKCSICNLKNDPHITTFDDFYYHWHGKCNYSISQLEFGYNERFGIYGQFRKCNVKASCIHITTFRDNPSTVIEIIYNHGHWVKVNNIPYYVMSDPDNMDAGGLHPVIAWSPDDWLPNNLGYGRCNMFLGTQGYLLATCGNEVFVWAPQHLMGHINGLCGHFDKDTTTDFTDRSGMDHPEVPYPFTFPFSWLTADQPMDGCDGTDDNGGEDNTVDPCTAGKDVRQIYADQCHELFVGVKWRNHSPSKRILEIAQWSCEADLCIMYQNKINRTEIWEWQGEMQKMLQVNIAIEVNTGEGCRDTKACLISGGRCDKTCNSDHGEFQLDISCESEACVCCAIVTREGDVETEMIEDLD